MYIVKDGGSMHIGIVALRILLSIILGYIIGFERKIRYNDAGPKTHAMVSAGACLFVIVSIYGFPDGTHDTARVAASIVTGISFLGTGNIVYNRGSIHGLTTAAGIWCTAAPVVMEPNTSSSAARPPVKVAILFSSSCLFIR